MSTAHHHKTAGYAMLLLVALLAVGVQILLLSLIDIGERTNERRTTAANTIAEARQALIGWSATHGDLAADIDRRPGNLPCPARDSDGNDDGNCSTAGGTSTGTLPWHSLAMVETRDANSGKLVHTIMDSFRRANLKRAATNSDTDGTAMIISADSYPLAVRSRELMPIVELRVLGEAQRALAAYAVNHGGLYPNAAAPADATCLENVGNIQAHALCPSRAGLCGGRLPEDDLAPYAARWFTDNAWARVMSYAVTAGKVAVADAGCPTRIAVTGRQYDYVLVTPGPPLTGQRRPSGAAADYLEDAVTQSVWNPGSSLNLVAPGAGSNDHVRGGP